jgi:hypothetical protein
VAVPTTWSASTTPSTESGEFQVSENILTINLEGSLKINLELFFKNQTLTLNCSQAWIKRQTSGQIEAVDNFFIFKQECGSCFSNAFKMCTLNPLYQQSFYGQLLSQNSYTSPTGA